MNITTYDRKFQREILKAIVKCRSLTASRILYNFLGGKTIHSSQLGYITARCDKRLDHVGVEVENIGAAISFVQSLPEKFSLVRPVFKSKGVPRRFRGSKGKIAFLANKKKTISLELFEIKWAPKFEVMESTTRELLIGHAALRVKSLPALYKIINILSKKQIKIDLPITENKAEGVIFTYLVNKNGDRLEFVYHDD